MAPLKEWLQQLPPEVREHALCSAELTRLLAGAQRYLRRRDSGELAGLEKEIYRLAAALEERLGHAATLCYLRDGLARALEPSIREAPECAAAAAELLACASDAVWRSYADRLEGTIQRQQADRLHQELMVAKRIQERLLPRSVPEIPGFDIAGRVLPAAEVGGDYWSCKSHPQDDLATVKLADVSGHGIAAATLVAAVKFISGGYYRGANSPSEVMERTNAVLVRETPSEILVTMVYAWLYPHTAEMTVVNAGHSPVLLFRAGESGRCVHLPQTGAALGLVETRYREIGVPMEPGDVFFTCSDGITHPGGADPLGEEWVEAQVGAALDRTAGEIVETVLDAALSHYGQPLDDMSVLVVKRAG